MTLLVHVLVAAAATLSSASGTFLILNEANVPLEVGAPLQLDCGVEGHYRHCFWETKNSRILQVEDVHAGLHAGLRAPHNLTHNQCGIVVEKSSGKDAGEWTCRVVLDRDGYSLKDVKTVGRACTPPFVSVGTECYYFSELTTKNWEEARIYCQNLLFGADLAVLDDCHQHQLVWSYILQNYELSHQWIGAIDRQQDRMFFWVDGTPVSMGMPFWYPTHPDGHGDCAILFNPDGYFTDKNCDYAYNFVCQQL